MAKAKKQTELPTVSISPNPRRWVHGDFDPVAYQHPDGDGQIYLTVHCQGADITFEFAEIEHAEALAKNLAETIKEEREARA